MERRTSPVAAFDFFAPSGCRMAPRLSRERTGPGVFGGLAICTGSNGIQFGGTCDDSRYRGRFEPSTMDDCVNASGVSYRCAGCSIGLSTVRSIAHARFAISSRMNSTSSSGPLSIVRLSVGGRKKRLVTIFGGGPGKTGGGVLYADCHSEKNAGGSAGSPIGRTRVRTPKVTTTTGESMRDTEPTGRRSGTTNQSFPYVLAYSIIIRCARSVGPTGTSPYAMRASSSSQKRGAGAPGKFTG